MIFARHLFERGKKYLNSNDGHESTRKCWIGSVYQDLRWIDALLTLDGPLICFGLSGWSKSGLSAEMTDWYQIGIGLEHWSKIGIP